MGWPDHVAISRFNLTSRLFNKVAKVLEAGKYFYQSSIFRYYAGCKMDCRGTREILGDNLENSCRKANNEGGLH